MSYVRTDVQVFRFGGYSAAQSQCYTGTGMKAAARSLYVEIRNDGLLNYYATTIRPREWLQATPALPARLFSTCSL
jgi:hypothetical protein